MKIKYLGTGAAERIPGIFCNCQICENALKSGGREIRTQTQTLLDDGKLLIDFPGDSYLHRLNSKIEYSEIEFLLITHWHSDHFYGEDLAYRLSNYANNITSRLLVYGNESVKKFYDRAFELEDKCEESRISYNILQPYEKITINDYEVYSIPAQHGNFNGDCFIFVIKDMNGKTMLYGHDTGYLTDEIFDYLELNKFSFDLVSMDCTSQTSNNKQPNHMGIDENLKLKSELYARRLVKKETIFVANHFSHNGGKTHEEMVTITSKLGIIIAYDGMEIKI